MNAAVDARHAVDVRGVGAAWLHRRLGTGRMAQSVMLCLRCNSASEEETFPMLKKLLLTTAALIALGAPADAAIVGSLGIDPTSATGAFSHSVGSGAFDDQFTFQLVGGPKFLTIASVTNAFPSVSDFIANFSGSVFLQVGAIGGGDDIRVIGPALPTGCGAIPNCQGFAGSAILDAGNYYLDISGIGGGTSGYGGNLAAAPVIGVPAIPETSTWAMMMLGLLGVGLFGMKRGRSFRLAA